MAEPKFSPGPWQARFIHRMIRAARKSPDILVQTEPENDWADANLMASAPDLYSACAETVRWIKEDTLVDLNELSDDAKTILVILVEALAKAKGEDIDA